MLLTLIVPFRIVLDLLWWVDGPGGFSVPRVGGGVVALVLVGLVAARWREVRSWELRWPALAVAAVLSIGWTRADGGVVALREGLLLATPVAFLAAWSSWGE